MSNHHPNLTPHIHVDATSPSFRFLTLSREIMLHWSLRLPLPYLSQLLLTKTSRTCRYSKTTCLFPTTESDHSCSFLEPRFSVLATTAPGTFSRPPSAPYLSAAAEDERSPEAGLRMHEDPLDPSRPSNERVGPALTMDTRFLPLLVPSSPLLPVTNMAIVDFQSANQMPDNPLWYVPMRLAPWRYHERTVRVSPWAPP